MGRKRRGRGKDAVESPRRENGREYPIDTGVARWEKVAGYEDSWNLLINGQYSSHITVGAPTRLSFPYMQWIAACVGWWSTAQGIAPSRLLHLGGAGCSLARFMAATYAQSSNTVVEIDAALARLARELCDVPKAPRVKIRVGEAREVTESLRPGSFDVVIRDVFSGSTTPSPLCTQDFFQAVARSMQSSGIVLVNCAARSSLNHARSEAATLASVFSNVGLIADHTVLKGKRGGNIIFLASNNPLPRRNSPAATTLGAEVMRGQVPAHYMDLSWVERFASGGEVLRDPVPSGDDH